MLTSERVALHRAIKKQALTGAPIDGLEELITVAAWKGDIGERHCVSTYLAWWRSYRWARLGGQHPGKTKLERIAFHAEHCGKIRRWIRAGKAMRCKETITPPGTLGAQDGEFTQRVTQNE